MLFIPLQGRTPEKMSSSDSVTVGYAHGMTPVTVPDIPGYGAK